MEKEESDLFNETNLVPSTPCEKTNYSDCLFLSLFFHFDDVNASLGSNIQIPAKLQVLLCLQAMLRTRRRHFKEIEWHKEDSLQAFLNSSSTVILIEIGRILHSSLCSVIGVKICAQILPYLSFESNSSIISVLLDK